MTDAATISSSRRLILQLSTAALVGTACTTLPPPAPQAARAVPAWTDKPVFSIVTIEIRDGKAFGEYVAGHAPTIAAAGGRFLVAGAMPRKIEGAWPERRMVIHEWPSVRAFLTWYDSAAYAPWKKLRHTVSSADVILVQGLASSAPSPTESPAFSVVDVDITEPEGFGRYVKGHGPTVAAGGGVFLIAGGRWQVVEGTWKPRTVVLHRWPSSKAFDTWYQSSDYRPWRDLRHASANANVALVAGLSEQQKAAAKMP